MAVSVREDRPRLSVAAFREFTAGRPEQERWELIDGVAVMMTPPTLSHQRIASNLQSLLWRALQTHRPAWVVFQRAGLNIGPSVDYYDPEPDVVVVDSALALDPNERYAGQFYLAAEVVSSSDRKFVERKREVYKLHEHCLCVLLIQQDRCEVSVERRSPSGWTQQLLTKLDDTLAFDEFGLRCTLADLYRGTRLQPR